MVAKLKDTWTVDDNGDRVCHWCGRHASLCVIESPCVKRETWEKNSGLIKEIGVYGDKPQVRYVTEWYIGELDRVQELIAPDDGPWVDPPLPTQEQWNRIVEAWNRIVESAFPPPPMA